MSDKKELEDLKLHEKLELFKTEENEASVIKVPGGLWYIYTLKSTREITTIGTTSIFVPDPAHIYLHEDRRRHKRLYVDKEIF